MIEPTKHIVMPDLMLYKRKMRSLKKIGSRFHILVELLLVKIYFLGENIRISEFLWGWYHLNLNLISRVSNTPVTPLA